MMNDFLLEAMEARRSFAKAVMQSPWDNEARTAADDLLIMYDQMVSHMEKLQQLYEEIWNNYIGDNREEICYTEIMLKGLMKKFDRYFPGLKKMKA